MSTMKTLFVAAISLFSGYHAFAQDSLHLSMQQAIRMGIDSSKKLQLSETKVRETINQYAQAKDRQLPEIKASLMGSEAFIPTNKIQIKGMMEKPFTLPSHSTMYIGTFGVTEAIFAGNKMRYAKESAQLLQEVAKKEKAHDREGVIIDIIRSYINLYKIDQNLKVIEKNIQDIQGRLEETIKFKDQGLATRNDVLRFELQKSQAMLSRIDLQNNRQIANFALITLLRLPDQTILKVDSIGQNQSNIPPVENFIQQALQQREDLQVYDTQKKLNQTQIKNIKADKLPVLGAGVNSYYVNPSGTFIPPARSYLFPVTIGLNLSWNISSLYTTKNKVSEARIQRQKLKVAKEAATDQVKIAVNKNYHAYLQSLQHIKVLQTAVEQAKENDRIMELKYRNQLATTTDRIDAQTMLYKSLIDLGLARADAAVSWYQLLSSTGKLNTTY